MKVVVGLGNPGVRYQHTRHNVGFQVLGELARRHPATKPRVKFEAEVVEVAIAAEKILLIAPQTYMNASGKSVGQLVDFFKLPLADILVVCDDLNLETGRLRLRASGSAGGQKGLADIIDRLGTQEFSRLRIGIGRPPERMDATDYVLDRFGQEEIEVIALAIVLAADAVEIWTDQGLQAARKRWDGTGRSGPQVDASGEDKTGAPPGFYTPGRFLIRS